MMLNNPNREPPPVEKYEIEDTNYIFQEEEDEQRFKLIKLKKGTSWKKRFQMMYRAKMIKYDK